MLKLMIVCGNVAHAQPARVILQIVQTVIETETKVEFQSSGFGPLLVGSTMAHRAIVLCFRHYFQAEGDTVDALKAARKGGFLSELRLRSNLARNCLCGRVYQRWCSSTLHIGWGLCDRLCPVLVCSGRCGWGGGVLLCILGSNLGGVGPERGLRGGGRRGWCEEWARSG
jgi:hypothetical protein